MKQRKQRMLPFIFVVIAALIACGPFTTAATDVVDTPSLEELQTFVAQTVESQSQGQPVQDTATVGVQAVASDTPIVPTIPAAPSKTPTDSVACDKVEFVSETIPDGTDYAPSATFTKTWRVRNIGTCTWDTSYDIVFDHGDTLGAPAAIPFPGVVAPGQEVDLSINLTAPASPGSYASYWKFRNGSDVIFVTNPFSAVIDVIAPTNTPGGILITLVPGPIFLLKYTTSTGSNTSIPASGQGSAQANCPSGSVLTAGGYAYQTYPETFVKTMSASGNSWVVYGVNQLGTAKSLNAYAICLHNSGGTSSQVYAQVSVPAGSNGHATVACPSGSVVTGGGFASSADFRVYNTSKDGNGWQTWAHNNSGSSKLLNVYAMCLSGTTATTSQVLTSGTIPANSYKGIEGACPSGQLVTGGGFAAQDSLVMYNTSMTSSDPATWITYAKNTSGSDRTIYNYTMCLSFP